VTGPNCYRYTLTGTDRVGNTATISTVVKVDTSAPSAPALTLSAATGNTYITSSTSVLINAQATKSGSFQVAATTSDADSGIQKVNFPTLAGFTSGQGDDLSSLFSTTYNWTGAVGATGAQTVTATNNATGTATSTFTVTPDIAGPTVTAVASKESDGVTTGDGKLENGDRLIVTFSEALAPATVPSTFSGATETRAGSLLAAQPHVFMSIPGFTNGTLDTGNKAYLANGILCVLTVCSAGTATFGGTAALSAGNTVVTLIVNALTGDATAASSGILGFKPAAAIQDLVGNGATGTFNTAGTFKLF
jgi:hypothetical protein